MRVGECGRLGMEGGAVVQGVSAEARVLVPGGRMGKAWGGGGGVFCNVSGMASVHGLGCQALL